MRVNISSNTWNSYTTENQEERLFFNETALLFWCHALWKFGSLNCCIFEVKHATGMETCAKIFFLFVFNLVLIRIHKTSLFWLNNLMTSLWKPSIDTCIRESGSRIGYHFRPFSWRKVVPSRMVTLSAVLLIFGMVMEPRSFSKSSKYGKIL